MTSNHLTACKHLGYTLVEVLTATAVLAVAAGLLLGAVQRVRSSAARSRCADNLRQTGLALHHYHAAHGRLPPGLSAGAPSEPYPYMSWLTRLLPLIEQEVAWHESVRAFETNRNFLAVPPHVWLTKPMPLYGCPADPRTGTTTQSVRGKMRGLTSYLGVAGVRASRADGCLYLNSTTRLADITDGTSSTLLVGERPPSADMILGWWYAGWGQGKDGEGDMVLGVRTVNNQVYGPGCPVGPYHYTPGRFVNQCDAFHFWSPHPGGTHFVFADGSVRFLRYDADPILPALATRAGGESVSLE